MNALKNGSSISRNFQLLMKTRAGKNWNFLDLEKPGIEFKKKLERSKKFPEISGIFQIAVKSDFAKRNIKCVMDKYIDQTNLIP